jgi:hypothetical protein
MFLCDIELKSALWKILYKSNIAYFINNMLYNDNIMSVKFNYLNIKT